MFFWGQSLNTRSGRRLTNEMNWSFFHSCQPVPTVEPSTISPLPKRRAAAGWSRVRSDVAIWWGDLGSTPNVYEVAVCEPTRARRRISSQNENHFFILWVASFDFLFTSDFGLREPQPSALGDVSIISFFNLGHWAAEVHSFNLRIFQSFFHSFRLNPKFVRLNGLDSLNLYDNF